jgi:hypothetical protein
MRTRATTQPTARPTAMPPATLRTKSKLASQSENAPVVTAATAVA